jgi:DNA polymerase III subunit gamma/tau
MPYTVLALKWRPKNFDEIVGQPHVTLTLKNAIQKNRLASAYLFAGPRGVGKTSTARILAKALNCKTGPTPAPCNDCSACREINDGRSLDVIEIDGASNRGIDEIRVLRENVKFAPASGKYKIYIIDEVHMLTTEAFNALLKTLEEPPEFVKFIFATTNPNKVIPTILSRCQRFDFRRITMLEIAAQLERIVSSEKIDVEKEVLYAVAKSSDGSLRDAESVLDQLVSFSKEKVSLKDVISVLGLVEQEALFTVTDKIINKDPRGALLLFNELIDNGKDMGVFLSHLIEHFRNLMVAKVTAGDQKLIDLPGEICEKLLKQSGAMSLEEIFSIFNTLVSTQDMAKRLDSLRIPLEICLIKLTHNKKDAGHQASPVHQAPPAQQKPPVLEHHTADSIREKIFPEVRREQQKQADPGEPPVESAKEISGISLDKIKEVWRTVIDSLANIKMSTSTYLSEGEPLRMQGNILTISFPKSYSLHKETLEARDNRALVEKCISESCNTPIRVNFVLVAQELPAKSMEENKIVRSAIELFGGRVIKEG